MLLSNRLLLAIVVIVGVPAVMVGYIALIERLVKFLPFRRRNSIRPWLWIAPMAIILIIYLVYPTIYTIYLSFLNSDSTQPVGFQNYITIFTTQNNLISMRNNLYWLVLLSGFVVVFGLLMAVIFDRVSYEAAAKALIFIPMAISFVAASIIWKLMYDFQPAGAAQTGLLNAVITGVGGQPVPWLIDGATNNLALIVVGIWMWTGFSVVILSAGLKGIPTEILEAARVDGATEWQIFFQITIPMMSSTIVVVGTTMVINALKVFDIVYVLTNGNFNTGVIANRMYKEMFSFLNFGQASALAVVLLIAIIPVMLVNINRFRAQEALR